MAVEVPQDEEICDGRRKGVLLLLFTRPLLMDGGMTEDHGAPEAVQLSRVWTRGRKEHGVGRVDSTTKKGRFQGGHGGQARRVSLEQVEGSMSG